MPHVLLECKAHARVSLCVVCTGKNTVAEKLGFVAQVEVPASRESWRDTIQHTVHIARGSASAPPLLFDCLTVYPSPIAQRQGCVQFYGHRKISGDTGGLWCAMNGLCRRTRPLMRLVANPGMNAGRWYRGYAPLGAGQAGSSDPELMCGASTVPCP